MKFVHEIFRRMRPGVPLACIHGRMKQARREHVFYSFVTRRLFCLPQMSHPEDWISVMDWVVNTIAHEDVQTATFTELEGRRGIPRVVGFNSIKRRQRGDKFPKIVGTRKSDKSIKMDRNRNEVLGVKDCCRKITI